jgi:hypothetical protein
VSLIPVLPAFRTPVLSKACDQVQLPLSNEVKPPKKMTRQEGVKSAEELRRQGLSLGEIAKMPEISKSMVQNVINSTWGGPVEGSCGAGIQAEAAPDEVIAREWNARGQPEPSRIPISCWCERGRDENRATA